VVELHSVEDLLVARLRLLDGEAVMRRSISGKIRSTFPRASVILDDRCLLTVPPTRPPG
jgi:hypothetical protein